MVQTPGTGRELRCQCHPVCRCPVMFDGNDVLTGASGLLPKKLGTN